MLLVASNEEDLLLAAEHCSHNSEETVRAQSCSFGKTRRQVVAFGILLIVVSMTFRAIPEARPDTPRSDRLFDNTSSLNIENPWCCGRGEGGTRGICLPSDPQGVCCGTEIALLCGRGSTCYTNGLGHPYCCLNPTIGCAHVCLDLSVAQNILAEGGACNAVSPQGFNAAGFVLHVDAPWSAENKRYNIDGSQNIMFADPPFTLGTGDFTLRATVTPRFTGRIGILNASGDVLPAILFSQSVEGSQAGTVIGLAVSFLDLNIAGNRSNLMGVCLVRDIPVVTRRLVPGDEDVQAIRVDITGMWRAGISVSFRVVRQAERLLVYVNDTLRDSVSTQNSQPVDVSSASIEPFTASPTVAPNVPFQMRADIDGFLSDMSVQTTAELP